MTNSRDVENLIENVRGITREDAIKEFTTEPIEQVASYYMLNEIRPSLAEALQLDLTQIVELDCLYRWQNASDQAITINGRPGSGKTLVAGSKVLMADGSWKKVEDVEIGDKVISPQADGSTVYAPVAGIHSRWNKENYAFYHRFKGKDKLLFACADNHECPVDFWFNPRKNGVRRPENRYRRIRIYSASQLAKFSLSALKHSGIRLLQGRLCEFEGSTDPEVDAYLLGVWLADGNFGLKGNLVITDGDPDVEKAIRQQDPVRISRYNPNSNNYGFSRNSELGIALIELGLRGKNSGTKFIPVQAKTASIKYRLNLLAGLMDTDGFIGKEGQMVYTSKSKKLCDDVVEVVFSLGGFGSVSRTIKICCNNGKKGVYWNAVLRLPRALPLKAREKIKRQAIGLKKHRGLMFGKTTFIVRRAKPGMVYGFEVDSPSHYHVTDNYIITHNSNCLLHYGVLWKDITGVPYRTSSINYSLAEYHLALKGMRIKPLYDETNNPVLYSDGTQKVTLIERPLVKGASISLDEAGDVFVGGMLSLSILLQTADMSKRIRALQVARFMAGVGDIAHQAYFSIQTVQRNPREKYVIGLVFMRDQNSREPLNLGFVKIPYVDQKLFDEYNRPKLESIQSFGRSVGLNRTAQLVNFFSEELWTSEAYQTLPIKPNSMRMNYLNRNPRYSVFPTERYFNELEKLTRNKDFHAKLTAGAKYKRLAEPDIDEAKSGRALVEEYESDSEADE